ncbi:hydroxyacylglutathione hydrolase [Amphritea sp. 1_MG-2023]|uniref:hydroxyacylglutathione hydrolase n=1 Tax=Amphritea sp. 1_MG-2023 TaxID=3062670 RepID=UPI0026E140E0|nr:hydroxyacylglutathione hydrolase [Amphritea sp. 1_MG-2023]MDO6562517.1 hydroxyacylglutathione hydrolase [Amphritea sp. 1_MG-2023]
MFNVTPIPAFNDNYIWALTVPGTDDIAVIDPGDAEAVNDYLTQNNVNLTAILITHHHDDHTGGVAQLCLQHSADVYGPANSPFKGINHTLTDGDQIELLGQQLIIHEVPGHTLDHISYFVAESSNTPPNIPQVFSGDTLFLAGCGRLFEGSAEQMHTAMEYFKSLPDNTQIYCTHEYSLANLAFAAAVEPDNAEISTAIKRCTQLRDAHQPTLPSTIAIEKQINPFLRYHTATVKHAAEQVSGAPLNSEVAIFSAIRDWKNQF